MSVFKNLYSYVIRKPSTYALSVVVVGLLFMRAFEQGTDYIQNEANGHLEFGKRKDDEQ